MTAEWEFDADGPNVLPPFPPAVDLTYSRGEESLSISIPAETSIENTRAVLAAFESVLRGL